MHLRTLDTLQCANKRVFLRADLNVSLINGAIQGDFRLQQLRPTLDFLLARKAKIILGTHLGRPLAPNPALSTQNLIQWFENNNYSISFAPSLDAALAQSKNKDSNIILLENLRFFPGETNNDAEFARQLAMLADCYVNDAFGLMHHPATSTIALAQHFSPKLRVAGRIVEKEYATLNELMHQPQKPFLVIIGGKKIQDKLPLLRSMLPHIDELLLCPALSFTFSAALGQSTGTSFIDPALFDTCKKFIDETQQYGTIVHLPTDYLVADSLTDTRLTITDTIDTNKVGLSFGPRTAQLYAERIMHARTIFFNGVSGFLENPNTLEGAKIILTAMNKSTGTTIIAGGDTVAAAEFLQLTNHLSFISTGGGATLAYLSKQPLPALRLLCD